MTTAISIAGIVVAAGSGIGGAWLGGWMQRRSGEETATRQLQIDAAGKFMAAIGEFVVGYASSNKPDARDLSATDRDEPAFRAWVALEARGAVVEIVGPEALATLAAKLIGHAQMAVVGPRESGLAAFEEMNATRVDFAREASGLRTQRQKNGRSRGDSAESSSASADDLGR